MRLFRKKEQAIVERSQRISSRVSMWFRSQERCDSNNSPKADVNAANADGMSELHVAAMKGCSSTIQKLFQEGADVNSTISTHGTDAGYTPLHYAVREGSFEIVKLLLKHNACVGSESDCGLTPLHIAAEKGNVPIAEALLNHGASIYAECTLKESNRYIPLYFAIKEHHLGVVKLLLIYGANSDTRTKYTETTIRLACSTKDYTIIAYVFMSYIGFKKTSNTITLLDAVSGSEVEYTNIARHVSKWIFNTIDSINSAILLPAMLHTAVEIGYSKIVKDFLKWGVDVHSLHHALHSHASGAIFGYTLLHTATKHCHLDIAKLLISHGAGVNVEDDNQRTPIFFAIQCLDVNMTKLLISNGATMDIEN